MNLKLDQNINSQSKIVLVFKLNPNSISLLFENVELSDSELNYENGIKIID